METLRSELSEIEDKLSEDGLKQMEARKLQRRAWVVRGVLDYDLNISLLEQIIIKFERIDFVPQGYFQPELFRAP